MDLISVDELDATGYDVVDSLLDLSGPCLFPFGIERLLHEALVDGVGDLVGDAARMLRIGEELLADHLLAAKRVP